MLQVWGTPQWKNGDEEELKKGAAAEGTSGDPDWALRLAGMAVAELAVETVTAKLAKLPCWTGCWC